MIIDDNFMVCGECLQALINDDYTSLDYYYDEAESTARMEAIQQGIDDICIDGYACLGDSDKDEDFSRSPCECCHTALHGSRYHMVILRKNPTPLSTRQYYI